MGQWSGGSLGQPWGRATPPTGATYLPYVPPARSSPSPRAFQAAALAAVILLLAGVVVLGVLYLGARGRLTSTRSSLAATRARLTAVLGALAIDTKALTTEQQVGGYLRAVRDILAPIQQAYDASAQASSDAAVRADDEQAIGAIAEGKQKLGALPIPDTLRAADGDLRSAMDLLAGGLQSEILAFQSQSVAAYTAALMVERQAIDHINTARNEMDAAIGTSGPTTAS